MQRTSLQNKSLHKYCELLGDALNDAGLDMRTVLKPSVDIPWSKDTVKDQLWKPIQKAMLHKVSTTELDTVDTDKVYKVLDRHLAEKFGISVDWPCLDSLMVDRYDEP